MVARRTICGSTSAPWKVASCNRFTASRLSVSPRPRRIGLAFRVDLLDPGRRGVGEPDMVPGADEEARRPRRRIVDRLSNPGVDQPDQGADDVARRPELTEFARLPDLPEHMLEQVALGVRVNPVEMQVVQLADHLGEHGRLVDHQPGAVHEVGDSVRG